MTFGRLFLDRNSLILENVLLNSLVLQDNPKPMVSTKDYMVHLFNYQKIRSKNNSLGSKKFIYTHSYLYINIDISPSIRNTKTII